MIINLFINSWITERKKKGGGRNPWPKLMYEASAEKYHVAKTQPNTDLKWHQPDRQKVRVDVNLNSRE